MKELPVVWNNKSGTAIPFSWNNTTRSGSPEKWNKIESSPVKWNNEHCLRENWGAANSARTRPSVWEEKHSLSEKWNTPEVLPDNWGTSEAAVRPHLNINLSQKAAAANKLISDAAGKDGSTIKNIAGNAVNFVRSEETAKKIRSIKGGAMAAAGGAAAAFAGLKGKAAAFAAEHKKSDDSGIPVNEEVIEDVNSVLAENYTPEEAADTKEDTSDFDHIEEASESESFDELYEKAMNSVDGEESNEAIADEADDTQSTYVSDEIEQPVAAPSVTQTPALAANSHPQQAYPQTQYGYNSGSNNNANQYMPTNYGYEEKKKSPVVFILIGVIAVLLVVAGILGGMLLMKNKNNKDSDDSGNNAAVSTTSNSENEISTSTVVDENNEFQTEISMEEIPTEPITENVADQYTSEEVFAMYSAYISENPDPNHTYDDPKYGYYLVDLNEDGTQELVITSDYIEYGSPDIEAVYAITQNRLEAIWLSDVRTYNFLCEGNIIQANYIFSYGHGTMFYKYSSKNNLEIVESVTYDGTDYRNTGKYIITNNADSVITEEEADAIRNQYKKMKFEAKPFVILSSDPYAAIKKEIQDSVDNEHYRGKDSHIENAPDDMCFYNMSERYNINVSSPSIYIGPDTTYSKREVYSDSFWVYGENSNWYYVQWAEGMGRFSHPCYGYMSKSNNNKYTVYDTSAAGSDFSFNNEPYSRQVRTESTGLNLRATPSTSAEIIIEMPKDSNISVWGVNSEWAYVSYTENGTTYYGYASRQYIALPGTPSSSIIHVEKYGTLYSPSGNKMYGLAESYLIDGGAESYVRRDLTHGWHVTAVNEYFDGYTYWYELYDSDDGDYYGWVNEESISFY